MNNNGQPHKANNLIAKIPSTAYKKVVCECGCDTFQQASVLMQYPGGLWSAKPVTLPIPIWVCWSCGKPYIDKRAKLVDTKIDPNAPESN